MRVVKRSIALLLFIGIFAGCEEPSDAIEKGEYITRMSTDKTEIPPPQSRPRPIYPWAETNCIETNNFSL